WRTVAPADYAAIAAFSCLYALSNQRRDDVRRFKIEVVALSIKIYRQEKNRIHSVLLAIGLALHQQSFLGNSVGGGGLLRITIPGGLPTEGGGSKFRIGADSASDDRFLNLVTPGSFYELNAHDRILIEESSGIFTIGADSAHHRR